MESKQPTRREFLRIAGMGALSLGVGGIDGQAAQKRKPNIIYIMSDELGYYELSCMGHPHFITPNIDRMAAEGVRFTQALAGCSVCAPTRCCLLTGKHMGHASVRVNWGGAPMREDEETIASVLKRAGYATGGFGKWGCGGRGSSGVPEKHGFDIFVGYYDQVHAHSYYPPYLIRNSEEMPLPGNEGGRSGKTYSHYVIMEEAKKFIRANKDRPFFCYLPITPPHGMFDIPDDDPAWQLYRDKHWPEDAKRYAAMVNMVDRNVGEIFDLLRELGLEQDTIVFFSGDNGGFDYFADKEHPRGFHAPNVNPKTGVAFRGRKGNLYEGGLRVPMIVRWPGHIPAGRVSDALWYFPDIFPTIAELAGAKVPDDIDGVSILPELLGKRQLSRKQRRYKYLYWEYGKQVAIRIGWWKAIRPAPDAPWELYNLEEDIEEKHNLADSHRDLLQMMKEFAEQAHEPVREGVYYDRTLEIRDQAAKWGKKGPPGRKVHTMPQEGLIPSNELRIVRVSDESRFNFKVAENAIDGSPMTIWHSKWRDQAVSHPHELVIDMGKERTVRGFRYLPRQDRSWNGTIKDCEFYVSNDPKHFETLAVRAQFKKTKECQEIRCKSVRGRYVLLRTLSEVNGGPWASVAELGIIGE